MTSADPQILRSADHEYRVIEALGEGGQGKTLLVERQGEPDSRYVLKLLRMEHVDDWKQVELFEREVTTLGTLDHPGIPRLVDRIVEDERTAGIVQTRVPGHTLAAQIAEHGPLTADRFEQVMRQCLEILAYLQQQVPPVMHRDINPRNVMLDDQRAYLIDFGAVRVGGKTDMTSVGTFGYMAPEQIIGRPTPASDMYGLGMTLVCLAERRDVSDLPIDASSGQVDHGKLLRTMEPRLRDVVLGMIEPGLGERLASPADALAQLDAPPPALVPAVQAPAVPAATSRSGLRLPLVLGLVAPLVIVPAIALLVLRSEPATVEVTAVAVAPAEPAPVPIAAPVVEPPEPDDPTTKEQLQLAILESCQPVGRYSVSFTVSPEGKATLVTVRPEDETATCIANVVRGQDRLERRLGVARESMAIVGAPEPPKPPPPAPAPAATLTDDNSAELTLRTIPAGAKAWIDGHEVCTTPCAPRVAFGERTVVVEHDGRRVERRINVLEDTALKISLHD